MPLLITFKFRMYGQYIDFARGSGTAADYR